MQIATEEDLRRLDDRKNLQSPPDFDYMSSIARVAALKDPLSHMTGYTLKQEHTQDASYFASLLTYDPVPQRHPFALGGLAIMTIFGVSFSYFGNLFCIWGNSQRHKIEPDMIIKVAQYVCDEGFIFVPEDLLEMPCDPENGFDCWTDRYFSHL